MAPQRFSYNNFTDEIRARLSIVDVVGRRVPLAKKGQNYWGCCPFHNEKTPSFSVNEEKGFYHCFGCAKHGDIFSFVMETEHLNFMQAMEELANMAGLKMPEKKQRPADVVEKEKRYLQICEDATNAYHEKLFTEDGAQALEYVRRRGFTDDMIKKYRIGYAPRKNFIANKFGEGKKQELIATGLCRVGDYGLYDFFRDKLMFPIFNPRGQVVAFSGRSLDGSEPKYINTTDTDIFHKRQTIFGFNFARDAIYRNNRTIIVEGQIDAIKMQTKGFPETVAPLGTALTEDHIAILCKSNRNIVFCFDGDGAGYKAAERACGIIMPFLRDNSDVRFAFVLGGKDPDEILKTAGEDAMRKIIDESMGLVDFLWKIANEKFVITTPGGRVQAEKFLKAEIEKITDNDLKVEMIKEYEGRKFNTWRKWKKNNDVIASIKLPDVDAITKNTLVYIVNTYPELVERYGDFLATLNIDFDAIATDLAMDLQACEKFIVSLKLQRYKDKLNINKRDLTAQLLTTGDESIKEQIKQIDIDIQNANDKLEKLMTI